MPLSSYEQHRNAALLDKLIRKDFAAVKNRQELFDVLQEKLSANSIDLSRLTGAYEQLIIASIKNTIRENQFQPRALSGEMIILVQKIKELGDEEKRRYREQAPEVNVEHQILTQGYVEPGHLLTPPDMEALLRGYVHPDKYTTGISITEDKGRTLATTLEFLKGKPGKIYFPANINGNHYILLTREADGKTITCWDPEGPPKKATTEVTDIIQEATDRVYGKAEVKYIYAGEQPKGDGFSCGYRVVQKILKEEKIDNAFTRVSPKDTGRLCFEYIKHLPSFKDKKLEVIEDSMPLVYMAEGASVGIEERVKEVVANKRLIQEQSDEYFAYALQDVYRKNSQIDGEEAEIEAKKLLRTAPNFDEIKKEVNKWNDTHAPFKGSFFSTCKEEVKKEEEKTIIEPTSPLITSF